MTRPPVPPFDRDAAIVKVRKAEDAWNGRDPVKVSEAYTVDSRWRNRSEFLHGRAEIVAFLERKWARELEYRLIKELWAYGDDRIAVRFVYEWHDDTGPVVPLTRERELAIRRGGLHGGAAREHQRRADRGERPPVPVAAGGATGRTPRPE